jgi:enediyne biosynthesis protein E4
MDNIHPPVFQTSLLMRFTGILFTIVLLAACKNKSEVQFVSLDATETGLAFKNEIDETEENNIMTYQYMYNGAGIAAGDINNDGLPDLYVAGNSVPNKLFLNKGAWKFEDITPVAKINDRNGDWKTGVTMADVNGDGWLDIYVCYSGNTQGEGFRKPVLVDNPKRDNQLFVNNGCKPGGVPTFTERAKEYGLDASGTFSTQSYFFDYDLDGDLDMFLVNHANTFYSSLFNTTKLRSLRHPFFGNKLYRNDLISPSSGGGRGEAHFTEVSEQAGIHGSGLNYGLSAGISDLNNDGWPDIYVTNDYDEQDFCYLNQGDGTFKEISHQAFGHLSKYSMGSDIADVNNDGRPDIFVADMLPEDNHRQKLLKGADEYDKYTLAADSGYHHQNMRNTLQVNGGVGTDSIPRFSELGQMAGLSNTDWSWAPLFADLDNDGWKDLVVTNGYLHDYTNMDFLKYAQGEIAQTASLQNNSHNWLAMIQKMPSTKISNYIFQNKDGLHFDNKTEDWGLSAETIANGAVYADFDNDGDLDLVFNNLNENISVYRNDLKASKNKFIKIRLEGKTANAFGIGSKVYISAGNKKIYQEAYFSRGYECSVEPVLTIGVGEADTIAEIKVLWHDGTQSVLKNTPASQSITIRQQNAVVQNGLRPSAVAPLFRDLFATSGIDFRHTENDFVDFKIQRLMPYQASRLGARMAVGDVNKDGNDDVYFGGAVGQSGVLFLGKEDGTFYRAASQAWQADAASEDIGAAFFDADKDGDLDLYVVSGGNEFGTGDPLYHDRLYVNDGTGSFTKNATALPATETTSGSCVVPADYDNDGDLDLFIGGRVAAQMYPITPKSYLYRNDSKSGSIIFTDVTETLSKELQLAGMVTDAKWNDVDNDGWLDLMVVGEWMPVRLFKNENGKAFQDITVTAGISGSEGWWSTVLAADVDNDGDTDFLLGNAGTNLQYHASPKEPLEYIVQDINGDGGPDPIMCYAIQGKSYPAHSLDELLEQVTGLRKKFYKYADYADATIKDLMDKDLLDQSYRLQINTLHSSWLENQGNGKFVLKALPDAVQASMINGFVIDDFDGDQQKEILCAGNFYPYKVEWGRSDAFMGALLKFSNGEATLYKPGVPLWLAGDIRDINMVKTKKGLKKIIVSRNNDIPGVYSFSL